MVFQHNGIHLLHLFSTFIISISRNINFCRSILISPLSSAICSFLFFLFFLRTSTFEPKQTARANNGLKVRVKFPFSKTVLIKSIKTNRACRVMLLRFFLLKIPWNYLFHYPHTQRSHVEITEIYSNAFLAKISWKQRIYNLNKSLKSWIDGKKFRWEPWKE